MFPTTVPLRMPVERRLSAPVKVLEFLNGSEQRFANGDVLNSFSVSFPDVPWTEMAALFTWFDTVKGAFDSTWSFTDANGTVYPHMALEADELLAVENRAERFSCSLKMRQVATSGVYTGTPATAYPAIAAGIYTQRPFTKGAHWLTTRNDLACGARVAWSELASRRRSWVCEYPVLTAAEVGTRVAFFLGRRGRLLAFDFHDPQTGTVVAGCRLDQDEIVVRNLGAGQWATTVKVVEVL